MEKIEADDPSIDLVRVQEKLRIHWLKKIKDEQIDIQLALYIPTMLGYTEKDEIAKRLDGVNEIQLFFDSDKKLMLLLGDSGAGKSLFGQWLVNDIWWKNSEIIPIFIHLPAIKIKAGFFEKYLKKHFDLSIKEIEFLKTSGKFLIILDSYDEMITENQGKNLHRIGKLFNWNAKVIISCRTEALVRYSKKDQFDMFAPYKDKKNQDENENSLQKRYVQFFDRKTQIPQYVEQWKYHNKDLVDPKINYIEVMNRLPGLSEMVTSPFILMIVMYALPKLMKKYLEKHETERLDLTRMALFAAFTEAWFERQRDKLLKNELINDLWFKTIIEDFHSYCEQLANLMWQNQVESVTYDPIKNSDDNKWDPFFAADGDFNDEKGKSLKFIRQGALLRIIDDKTYTFLHKSLWEYFAAKKLFESAANKASIAIGLELNSKLLTRNLAMVRLGVDCLSENPVFEQSLWDILEESKHEPRVQIAAANAITILNAANRSFAGKNLRRIRVRYANVAGGNFEEADLQEADLRDVDFTQAWLTRANLTGSCLDNIRTVPLQGEQLDAAVLSCAFSPDGKQYSVLTNNKIFVFNAESHECVKANSSPIIFSDDQTEFFHLTSHGFWNFKDLLNSSINSHRRSLKIDFNQRLDAMLFYISLRNKKLIKALDSTPSFIMGYTVSEKTCDSFAKLLSIDTEAIHSLLEKHFDIVKVFMSGIIKECIIHLRIFNELHANHVFDSTTTHQDILDDVNKYSTDPNVITRYLEYCFEKYVQLNFTKLIELFAEDMEENYLLVSFSIFALLFRKNIFFWRRNDDGTIYYVQDNLFQDLREEKNDILSYKEIERIDLLTEQSRDSTFSWVLSHKTIEFLGCRKEDLPGSISYRRTHDDLAPYDIEKNHYYFRLVELYNGILTMTHSQDKTWFLIDHQDEGLILLNSITKNEKRLVTEHKLSSPDAMIFSPNENCVFTGLMDGTIRIWDTTSGQLQSTWMAHQVSVMVISKDGTWALSGSLDGTIKQWNVTKGECTGTWTGHSDKITTLVLSPDESWALSGSADGILKRWELTTHQLFMGQGHSKSVTSVYLSNDKLWAFTESEDGTSKRWNVNTGQYVETLPRLLDGSDKDRWGITSSESNDNKQWSPIWKALAGKPLTTLIRSDKNWALAGYSNGEIIHYTKNLVPFVTWKSHTSAITALTSNPEGSMVFSCDNNGKVMLWKVSTGELLARCGILNPVSVIKWYSNNPALIMMGMSDGALSLWAFNLKNTSLKLQWRSRPWMIQANNTSMLGVYGLATNQRTDLSLKGARVQTSTKTSEKIVAERTKTEIRTDFSNPPNSSLDHTLILRPEAWVISIVRKKTWNKTKEKHDPREHAFLVLESIEGEFHCIRRIDFVLELRHEELPKGVKKSKSGLYGQGLIEIADKSLFDLQSLVGQCCSVSSGITRHQGMLLLENIRKDQDKRIGYSATGAGNIFRMFRMKEAIEHHNCISWCEKHLENIGVYLTKKRWIDGILNYPPLKIYEEPAAMSIQNQSSPRDPQRKDQSDQRSKNTSQSMNKKESNLNNNNNYEDDQEPTTGSKCSLM